MPNRVIKIRLALHTSGAVKVSFKRESENERRYTVNASDSDRIEDALESYRNDDSYEPIMRWTFSDGFVLLWWNILRPEEVDRALDEAMYAQEA